MLNYFDLSEDLDFVAWDNYPVRNEKDTPYEAAAAADLMRGMKRKNFWIMEQTAGPAGWGSFGRNPKPGEIRKVAYQQLAHGCDGQVWFRWRTCTAGREQYWHGLLGHDGKPLRRYREAAQTAGEYHQLWPELSGTTVKSRVAFLYDYDSLWALQIQPGFSRNSYQEAMTRYYRAFFRAGINVDMISAQGPFDEYDILLAPDMYVLPDTLATKLDAFVTNGGILLTDCRAGVKDEWNLCHERTLPGLLGDCLGITIEEYGSLEHPDGSTEIAVKGTGELEGNFTAHLYTDWLTPTTAEVLAGYAGEWSLVPFAAATRNIHGKGWGYYVGTVVKEEGFYDALVAELLSKADLYPVVSPPLGVESSIREDGDRRYLFLINHSEKEQAVSVPAGGMELISGRAIGTQIKLERFGVAVIRLNVAVPQENNP